MSTIHVRAGRKFSTRYLLGDDLTGTRKSEATFWRDDVTSVTLSRWGRLAGWKRAGARITALPAAVAAGISIHQDPTIWTGGAGTVGTILAGRTAIVAGRRARHHRFRRMYLRPLARTIGPAIAAPAGRPDGWLHISPEMSGLAARLIRPMSPAEIAVRRIYGARVAPILVWVPERVMRTYWWARDNAGPVRNLLDGLRTPVEARPARVEISLRSGFATKEQRDLIRQAVVAKLGLGDLVESWDQVGPTATVTYTVRERPPSTVGLAEIRGHLDALAEHEYVIGLTTGSRPVIISLDDDAPHIACSAGSGAGKSVLAKVIAAQVLAKGGKVLMLDRKGSHRWARDRAGVEYCTTPASMHHALLRESAEADDRNAEAFLREEGWDPGVRTLIIFEEMNATIAQLRQWWDDNREKSDPKASPAVAAFRNLMFMGRSAKKNLFSVAQMLTANTTGGPEARENFGVRCLARYTANAWKMLAPECPMPRKSKTRGRWQVVIAGESTEVQVAYLTDQEAKELANVPMSLRPQMPATQQERTGTTVNGDTEEFVSLRDAQVRFCPGIGYDALKKRRDRARKTGGGPQPRAQRGRAELYDADEFLTWLQSESLTSTETRNA
jgi:hypothetical protein